MTNILLVTSSPRGSESLSTRFATEIADGLSAGSGGHLVKRDLAADPLPHIGPAYIKGRLLPAESQTPQEAEAVAIAQTLIEELKAADVIVIGSALINFGLSSQIKAWFDHITMPGATFSYSQEGAPEGLLTGKKVYLVTAAGGIYSEGELKPIDFQTNYLLHLLGFIGLTDVEIVRVEGTVFGPELAEAAIAATQADVHALLARQT